MLINNPYIPQRECDSNSQLEEQGLNINSKRYFRPAKHGGLKGGPCCGDYGSAAALKLKCEGDRANGHPVLEARHHAAVCDPSRLRAEMARF